MTTLKVIATIGTLLAILAASTDVCATPRRAEAERELQITQRVIDKVRRLVDESENRRAEDPLRRAIELQGEAHRQFRGEGFRMTVRLTLVARDFAKRAAKLAGELSENREFVFRQLERTRDVLRKAREQARDAGEVRVRDLLRTAFERQEQAETAFREHRFRVALRMTQLARQMAHKAVEMIRGEPGADPQRVHDAIEKTDEVLGRVSRELEGRRPPLLEEAFDLQDRAEAHFGEGRFGPALKLTLTARDLAHRATKERDGPYGIVPEIEATRDLVERAERLAAESDSNEAKVLAREARSHLEEAQAHLESDDHVAARAQLKLARRKAERALEVAGGI